MNDRKVIILGIDGMDPKLCKRFLDEGKLPNIQKMLDMGAAREDLMMLGGVPTITPPMWTSLSTGAYPMTHGVTCYWNTAGKEINKLKNNFNSANVKAEQLWEVSSKAGKKTLVWTWPCSWPPVIDNPNLHIVGGMAPTGPNSGYGTIEGEHLIYGSTDFTEISLRSHKELKGGAGCIITDDMKEAMRREDTVTDDIRAAHAAVNSGRTVEAFPSFDSMEGEELIEFEEALIRYNSPIKEPKNWKFDIPEGAKEFSVIGSMGRVQYPALILKNEEGIYDTVAVYKNKKDSKPLDVIKDGEFHPTVVTDAFKNEERISVTRHLTIVELAPDGNSIIFSVGEALDITTDGKTEVWSPKSLYQQTLD
ncbi:MAG: alkaline phosphatase family protein, partial [Peptococcaceae bacterium]|nr:alkaline phosphatase family protein [Peptococcaceae bacterium]